MLKYLDDCFKYQKIDKPLWWHTKGLSQTATGYGSTLTTSKMVVLDGEKIERRVYAICYSNAASCYVTIRGERYYLRG